VTFQNTLLTLLKKPVRPIYSPTALQQILLVMRGEARSRQDLLHLVHWLGRARYMEARDKIYGLMSLLDTSVDGSRVEVDYNVPVEVLCLRVLSACRSIRPAHRALD
jgi:hypothetical protein